MEPNLREIFLVTAVAFVLEVVLLAGVLFSLMGGVVWLALFCWLFSLVVAKEAFVEVRRLGPAAGAWALWAGMLLGAARAAFWLVATLH